MADNGKFEACMLPPMHVALGSMVWAVAGFCNRRSDAGFLRRRGVFERKVETASSAYLASAVRGHQGRAGGASSGRRWHHAISASSCSVAGNDQTSQFWKMCNQRLQTLQTLQAELQQAALNLGRAFSATLPHWAVRDSLPVADPRLPKPLHRQQLQLK